MLVGPGSCGRELAETVAVLRARGVRTAILSNDPGGPAGRWISKEFGSGRLVDAVLLSGDLGVAKPDAASYRAAVDRLGLTPGECVFVDDLRINVRGAVDAGLVGVHHEDPLATIGELAVLFGIDDDGDPPGVETFGRGEGDTRG